jgi:hypothetical protein
MNVYEKVQDYKEKNNCNLDEALKGIGCTRGAYYSAKNRMAAKKAQKKVVRIVDPAILAVRHPSLSDSLNQINSALGNIKRILGL